MKKLEHHSRRGVNALRGLIAPCLAAAMIALAGCQTEPGGGTENSGIRLTGRVVGNNSSPVAGVVVALSRAGLTDTTDALGRYVLAGDSVEADSTAAVLDTLRFVKNGQSLARVSVIQWVEELPDVQVIQRDVSGLLDTEGLTATRIEAVLLGDGIDSADPVTSEFYYNSLTGNYSGFLYFPPTSSTAQYTVQINVYGADDVLIGQSAPVPFNSFAGNITVPAFSAGNSVPVPKAGADTAVALGATVNLRGTATDAFGGVITKWEWSIGDGPFVETSGGDTSFTRATPGAYPAILRVTDDDGNTAVDTAVVAIVSHGTNWTARTSGTTAALNKVIWAGTQFVAVGAAGTALTSPDGINWTLRSIDPSPNVSIHDIAWNGKAMIAMAAYTSAAGRSYYRSTDGVNWDVLPFPHEVGLASRVLVSSADTTFFAASQDNMNHRFLRSEDDGLTWTVDSLPRETGGIHSAIWSFTKHAGRFVGVGGHGAAGSSASGGLWTRHVDSETYADPWPEGGVHGYTMMAVVSTGTQAVAVGYRSNVIRSADGMNWTPPYRAASLPDEAGSTRGDLHDVAWTGEALVAVGNDISLLSADDGRSWAHIYAGSNNLSSVAWNGTRLVAVGPSGEIVTSD